jgi:lipoate-protein ligase A
MRFTIGRLPAREAIAADEALLELPGASRFWLADAPAVVVGLGLHHRLASVVDLERCRTRTVDVVERRAGGGAVLLDTDVLCGAIALPTSAVAGDVTESYRWLGDVLVQALSRMGVTARRVEVAEARADIARLRASDDAGDRRLLNACYGALSPHEVVVDTSDGPAKVVGLAQVRRRNAALFQFGILLSNQAPLADLLRVDDERDRASLSDKLERRTIGLEALTARSASEVAAAIADATPFAQ